MSLEENAGAAATKAASGQKPGQVSTEKKSAPEDSPNLSEEAKTQEGSTERSKEEGAKEKNKTSKEELRFDKHPAWMRRERKLQTQNAKIETQQKQIDDMSELMKEMIALQKGENFTPTKKTEDSAPHGQELLDLEMDRLIEKNDLSSEDEKRVIEFSKKFPTDIGDGKKVFLSPEIALALMKEAEKDKEESDIEVDTKPSKGAAESKVANQKENRPKAKDLAEATARAKRALVALQANNN